MNYNAVGVEPVPSFVGSAEEYLDSPERVLEGSAEEIPLPSGSQDLVVCESVLEHVDSPTKSLDEVFRVLRPGGIVFVGTTDRYRISLRGYTREYNIKYFNCLPEIVKESYVFHHLHYDPSLANYSLRPAYIGIPTQACAAWGGKQVFTSFTRLWICSILVIRLFRRAKRENSC